jgi:hypothetical protein
MDMMAIHSLATECRQQSGVNIQHAASEILRDPQELQKAGEANEIGVTGPARLEYGRTERLDRIELLPLNDCDRQIRFSRPLDPQSARLARHDLHNPRIELLVGNAVDQVLQRRAVAG